MGSAANEAPRLLYDAKVGAPVIGNSPATLESKAWRDKHGIPYFKVGRLVRYDLELLRQWAEAHRQGAPSSPCPTSSQWREL